MRASAGSVGRVVRKSQVQRAVGVVATIAVLGATLTGCQFLGDLSEGQRISSERLAVDSALRQLTAEIEGIDEVDSVEYDFDAGDVASTPSLHVEMADVEFSAWHEVASRIEEAGAEDAMSSYPVAVTLDSPSVGSSFDSQYGASWLSADSLSIAADAAAAFPDSRAIVSGASESAAFITVPAHATAEQVLARLADDPVIVQLSERARAGGHWLSISTDGLEVAGTPSAELAQWTVDVLAAGVPRLVMSAEPTEPLDEWVTVSLSVDGQTSSISASWAGGVEPSAGGQAWDAFVSAMRAGPPGDGTDDGCVPVYLSYSWPEMGGSASAFANCGDPAPVSGNPDRPSLAALRDALAAQGIAPEDLGFELS